MSLGKTSPGAAVVDGGDRKYGTAVAVHNILTLDTTPLPVHSGTLTKNGTVIVPESPTIARGWTDAARNAFTSLRAVFAASMIARSNRRRRNWPKYDFLECSCMQREMVRRF